MRRIFTDDLDGGAGEEPVNSFVIQLENPSRGWPRRALDFGVASVARQPGDFLTIDSAEKHPRSGPLLQTNSHKRRPRSRRRGMALRFSQRRDALRRVRSFFVSTIINPGLALTRTYLAISRSHSQPWLSRTTNAIGSGLNLTSLQSEVGRAWPLEIPSAGPVAGAGIPAGGAELSWVGTAVPAVRDLGFGGLGTARPTTAGKSTGGTPVQLFSAGNRRQPEVWIA